MTRRQEPSTLGRIVELVRDLRERCPWDAAQTRESLRPYLVEEVLELDHAIGSEDPNALKVELGDVMLHVAFQIVLAEELAEFGADDLTRGIEQKMWRRHPHLFRENGERIQAADDGSKGNASPVTREGVAERWERLKRAEGTSPPSVLDGLPPTLPALIMAFRLQERAAGVGFDWPDWTGPRAKVTEETEELDRAIQSSDEEQIRDEIGDLLFATANLARKLGIDPRAALERANKKFRERFEKMETLATAKGIEIGRAGLDELDTLWEEVKNS